MTTTKSSMDIAKLEYTKVVKEILFLKWNDGTITFQLDGKTYIGHVQENV